MALLDGNDVRDREGETFPLPRSVWGDRAHSKDVLNFLDGGSSFARLMSVDPVTTRAKFADMARAMTMFGSATTLLKKNGTTEEHPERALAYLDTIAMGEDRGIRQSLIADVPGQGATASSCGMFIRNLLKMVGVDDPSYQVPYVPGTVIHVEHAMAANVPEALMTPTPGDLSVIPQEGDLVHLKTNSQHFFVACDPSPVRDDLVRFGRKAKGFMLIGAQGGQHDYWLGGNGDTATNQAVYSVYDDWTTSFDGHPVDWWIDIEKLVIAKCDGGNYIVPFVTRTWSP